MRFKNVRLSYSILVFSLLGLLLLTSCHTKQQQQVADNDHSKTKVLDRTTYVKVSLQLQWLHQAQFAGFYVAHKKGYYKNYGLDVNIEMGGPGKSSPEIISNQGAEFGTMFLTSAVREIDKGNEIVNIAQLSQKSSQLLVAKKSSGIHKISDINGRRIGLWASDFNEPSIIFLNKNKIKAQIVPISWTTNVLTHDVVDVMNMMLYNEYHIFLTSGHSQEDLTVFPLYTYGVNIPEDGVYCHRDYYEKNQSLCQDFAEASLDGWFYALNNEEEALSIVLEYLNEAHLPANIPHQRWMFQKVREAILYKPEQFGKLSELDYNSSLNMMKQNGMLHNYISYRDFVAYAVSKKN